MGGDASRTPFALHIDSADVPPLVVASTSRRVCQRTGEIGRSHRRTWMSGQTYLAEASLSGGDYGVVVVVAVVALAALAVGYVLLKEVLAAGQGTAKMQDIAKAVQEGAAAYLKRQRNTLSIFGVVVFL